MNRPGSPSRHLNTVKHAMPNAVYAAFAYPLFLLVSLSLVALIWASWVSGRWYICTDPFLDIFEIIPPFVHPGTGDVYLVPEWRVWLVWGCLMALAVALPALAIWFVWRRERDYDA
jgi:hypothetical protein